MSSIRKWRDGEWQIDYRRVLNGQQFGHKEIIKGSKAYAREVLNQRENELDRSVRLGESPEDRVAITMDAVLDGLVEYYELKGRRSLDRVERSVVKLKEHFTGKRADRVTVDDIEHWRRWRYDQQTQQGKKPAPATVNRELAALKTAFTRAVKNRKLTYNPALYIDLDAENNWREVMWTDAHFRTVWALAKPYQHVILGLLRFCGLRANEARMARFEQIDDRGLLIIPPEIDKTGRGRKVPIPARLLMYIRKQRCPLQTHLIWYRRGPIGEFRGSIYGLLARAKIEDRLWAHDFRRNYDHHAREVGMDEPTIRAILGHSQGGDAHARYVVVTEDDIYQAGKKMERGLLRELLEGEILLDSTANFQ
jgi:site-specific recombinase XerD